MAFGSADIRMGNLSTGSCQVNQLVSGGRIAGIPAGQVTELAGMSGTGKTQFCLQLCSNLPPGDSAIYIDTDGSFSAHRLLQVLAQPPGSTLPRGQEELEHRLANVEVYRATTMLDLLKLLNGTVPSACSHRPRLRLLVLDSIGFLFRQAGSGGIGSMGMAERARILSGISQTLKRLATKYNLFVVVTNQMTTRLEKQLDGESKMVLVPALGEAWTHAAHSRLILYWGDQGTRTAWLVKSSMTSATKHPKDGGKVPFQITVPFVSTLPVANRGGKEDGIRDL